MRLNSEFLLFYANHFAEKIKLSSHDEAYLINFLFVRL